MSTFKVTGKLSLDGTNFQAGLARAESSAKAFGRTVTHEIGSRLAGVFALGAIEEVGRKIVHNAGELVNVSQRIGKTVEEVQLFKKAAAESNVELDSMVKAFEKIDIARAKALAGGDEGQKMQAAFARLGVSQADLQSKSASDIFTGPLASAVKGKSPEDLGPMLKEVLGKGFGEVIPVLQQDFAELSKKLRDTGSIMSTETAVSLKTLADEVEMLGGAVLGNLAPQLARFGMVLLEFVAKLVPALNYTYGLVRDYVTQLKLATIEGLRWIWEKLGKGDSARVKAWDKEADRLLGQLGKGNMFDKAAEQYGKDLDKWNETVEGIKRKMEENAERLKHPAKPVFDVPEEPGKQKIAKNYSDSLIAVGNFLGAARDPIVRVAEQQLSEARRTNTLLEQIAVKVGTRMAADTGLASLGLPPI